MTNALSRQVDAAARKLALQRARLERLVAREYEANVARHRAAVAKASAGAKAGARGMAKRAAAAARKRAPTIVAEGDSWFRYVVGFAVIWHLENKLGTPILNLASPGDETSEMLSGRQRDRIRRVLKQGPALKRRYDYLLFSGGGNDLVGNDRLENLLHDYVPGMSAAKVINAPAVELALAAIEKDYRALIALRDQHSPTTHIVLHAYDFPIPSDVKVCGRGPWLRPSLNRRGVPAALQPEVLKLLMLRLKGSLERVTAGVERISIVPTQGTLAPGQWENELHPTKSGFGRIAEKFVAHLQAAGPAAGTGTAPAAPKIARAVKARLVNGKAKAQAKKVTRARTRQKAKP